MRLAARLVTSISRRFSPSRRYWPTGTLKGKLKAVPANWPLSVTRALWQTLPRSSIQSSANVAGFVKVREYLAVPAKVLVWGLFCRVQDASEDVSNGGGSSGPPSRNITFQVPSMGSPAEGVSRTPLP